MSEATAGREQLASAGYTLVAGAAVLLASGLVLFVAYGRSLVLAGAFALVAAAVATLGFRSLAAASDAGPLAADAPERDVESSGTAAFWLLLALVLLDSAVGVVPGEYVPVAYVYVGAVAFLLVYATTVVRT